MNNKKCKFRYVEIGDEKYVSTEDMIRFIQILCLNIEDSMDKIENNSYLFNVIKDFSKIIISKIKKPVIEVLDNKYENIEIL